MAFQRSAQIGGCVALGSACGYGVAKDQRAGFTQAVGLVKGSARLNFPQHAQKFRRGDFIDGAVAEIGKDVAGDTLKHVLRVAFRPGRFFVLVPFTRYGLKRVFPSAGNDLFLHGRVDTPAKLFLGGSTGFSRFFQGELGVCAEGKKFFAALKSVFQAPAFGAAWRDIQKEAVAVKGFCGLLVGFAPRTAVSVRGMGV